MKPDVKELAETLAEAKRLQKEKKLSDAISLLEEARTAYPDEPRVLSVLVLLYFEDGQSDKSIDYFKKTKAIDPKISLISNLILKSKNENERLIDFTEKIKTQGFFEDSLKITDKLMVRNLTAPQRDKLLKLKHELEEEIFSSNKETLDKYKQDQARTRSFMNLVSAVIIMLILGIVYFISGKFLGTPALEDVKEAHSQALTQQQIFTNRETGEKLVFEKFQRARELGETLSKSPEATADAHLELALIYLDYLKFEKLLGRSQQGTMRSDYLDLAETQLQLALQKDSKFLEAHFLLAEIKIQKQDYESALEILSWIEPEINKVKAKVIKLRYRSQLQGMNEFIREKVKSGSQKKDAREKETSAPFPN
ncbi:MAG: tetratricopeptide repeat protein [Vulcanimicrobiota bacterium]